MGTNFCGCLNSTNNSKTETNILSNKIYVNNNNNMFIKLEYYNNSNKKRILKYNKTTFNTLPKIEKITIKNQVNKIKAAYKSFLLRKNVSYFFRYF